MQQKVAKGHLHGNPVSEILVINVSFAGCSGGFGHHICAAAEIQTSCVTMRPVTEVEDGGQLLDLGLVMQNR